MIHEYMKKIIPHTHILSGLTRPERPLMGEDIDPNVIKFEVDLDYSSSDDQEHLSNMSPREQISKILTKKKEEEPSTNRENSSRFSIIKGNSDQKDPSQFDRVSFKDRFRHTLKDITKDKILHNQSMDPLSSTHKMRPSLIQNGPSMFTPQDDASALSQSRF